MIRTTTLRLVAALVAATAIALAAITASASAADFPPPGSQPSHVSPIDDPQGVHPGLTAVGSGELAQARSLIGGVATAPAGSTSGYDRTDDFGPAWTDSQDAPWGHDGCGTRDEVLHRDLTHVTFRDGDCVVATGTLADPYTAKTIQFSKANAPTAIQIDHVMPLAYDWAQGARDWTKAKREQIANDPLNLVAVDGPTNEQKSDSGAADWMPPNHAIDCAYSVRIAQVSDKYDLPVTTADRSAMLGACS